jgi:hypothetical protein
LLVNEEKWDKKIQKEISFLSNKEKALILLITSPILSLKSKMILSRSSPNIKKIITRKEILRDYESVIINKIKIYENKLAFYNQTIISGFTPSITSEITLNFITKNSEEDFISIYNELLTKKNDPDFIYYKCYIRLIYYVINEDQNQINEDDLLTKLFHVVNQKGYDNLKDYFYFLYISKLNDHKENGFIKNIEKINDMIRNDAPNLLSFSESGKACRFIKFSFYLIKEVVDFGNTIKNMTKLEMETKVFIDTLKSSLNKFRKKFIQCS